MAESTGLAATLNARLHRELIVEFHLQSLAPRFPGPLEPGTGEGMLTQSFSMNRLTVLLRPRKSLRNSGPKSGLAGITRSALAIFGEKAGIEPLFPALGKPEPVLGGDPIEPSGGAGTRVAIEFQLELGLPPLVTPYF